MFRYGFPVDHLIQQFKYHERLDLADTLGRLLAEQVSDAPPDVWIPMPLHSNRLKQRGFNQSVEMTRALAQCTRIPMRADWATRERDTPPQAGLKRAARQKNLRGAFACSPKVAGLHIGIVDDVMTTGSTLDSLASTLVQAGAARVSCLVLARA